MNNKYNGDFYCVAIRSKNAKEWNDRPSIFKTISMNIIAWGPATRSQDTMMQQWNGLPTTIELKHRHQPSTIFMMVMTNDEKKYDVCYDTATIINYSLQELQDHWWSGMHESCMLQEEQDSHTISDMKTANSREAQDDNMMDGITRLLPYCIYYEHNEWGQVGWYKPTIMKSSMSLLYNCWHLTCTDPLLWSPKVLKSK